MGVIGGRLQGRFEAVWHRDWWLARDAEKAAFLEALGLTVTVRIRARQQKPRPENGPRLRPEGVPPGGVPPRKRGCGPFVPRLTCGLCELELACPLLGVESAGPLTVQETDQELKDYSRLRLLRVLPSGNSNP